MWTRIWTTGRVYLYDCLVVLYRLTIGADGNAKQWGNEFVVHLNGVSIDAAYALHSVGNYLFNRGLPECCFNLRTELDVFHAAGHVVFYYRYDPFTDNQGPVPC